MNVSVIKPFVKLGWIVLLSNGSIRHLLGGYAAAKQNVECQKTFAR